MKFLSILALALVFIGAAPLPATESYTIQNTSSQPLGAVTLSSATSQTIVNIMLPGNYPAALDGQATSITICGQQVFYPQGGKIVLPTGTVKVVWSETTNLVGRTISKGASY